MSASRAAVQALAGAWALLREASRRKLSASKTLLYVYAKSVSRVLACPRSLKMLGFSMGHALNGAVSQKKIRGA